MAIRLRRYDPSNDFLKVRSLLTGTRKNFERPLNWRVERWSYARYFCAPYLCRNEDITPEKSAASIRFWEDAIGIWEDGSGEVVGAVHTEHPWLGDAFIQRHPGHIQILGEMLDFAESNLVSKDTRSLRLFVYEHDTDLLSIVKERGYRKVEEDWDYDQEVVIRNIPGPALPVGYTIKSMDELDDLEGRGRAFGLGFNHPDPIHWAPVHVYQELQRAPDYRKDLDICVVSPDGEIVSFCVMWYDAVNRIASLEPVGTVPGHRRLGLAREAIREGLRRVSALGAERAIVGGGQKYYESLGFEKTIRCYGWVREF